ncbi:MAG: radical SAM protein [Carboxydocellales bacterium]
MPYVGNIYRPPSEAYSFILQITVGCSHNSCSFCVAFKDKKYRIKDLAEIKADLEWAKNNHGEIRRIFLADGDALSADTPFLLNVLSEIKQTFPKLERIGIYAGPWSLLEKTPQELTSLRKAGISILYLGLESGSSEILHNIAKKDATPEDMLEAAHKAKAAGFILSVTIILGLGGLSLTHLHAQETAKVLNVMQPEYLGALTLMLKPPAPLRRKHEKGEFELLNSTQMLQELQELISNLEQTACVFRANHASNYLVVKGTLPQDKADMLSQLSIALEHLSTGTGQMLRPEHYRRL